MIKKENYVQISGWMISELNLSGNELIAYALRHGFSQDGKSVFRGSLSYMQEWLNCGSRQTVIKTVKSLVEKNFIEKRILYKDNEIIGCEYWTVISRNKDCKTMQGGGPKNGLPLVQKLDHPGLKNGLGGSPNSRHNILNSNSSDTATVAAIKAATDRIFGENFFDYEFPSKAAEFLSSQNIDDIDSYLEFIKGKSSEKKARSPRGFAYKIFFQTDIAEEFRKRQWQLILEKEKAEKRKYEEEKRRMECPACGERFSSMHSNSCPKCEFQVSDFCNAEKIARHKKYMSLSETMRKKYDEEFMGFKGDIPMLRRLSYFASPQGTDERRKFIAALDKKYGIDEGG